MTLYLYSGKNEGYTYARAVKEAGGDHRKVIMVDIENGEKWNMVEGGLYAELLHMAMEGQISAVLASPNCRTRSKLRHIDVPGMNLPGPARAWKGEEWGKVENTAIEQQKCWEDDVMMFRAWAIFIVAEEVRKAGKSSRSTKFLLEHPSAPDNMPEVVSIWKTTQWQKLKEAYQINEVNLDQGEMSDGKVKLTTLGTNLNVAFPKIEGVIKKPRNVEGKTAQEIAQQSKKMARWVPLMTSAIAEAALISEGVQIKIRSWRTHLLQHHHPFHKGCKICQEAAGRGKPHYKQKLPPRAGVLSVDDLAGPMKKQQDIHRKYGKYLLVATVTWPREGVPRAEEDPTEAPPGVPEGPKFEEDEEAEDGVQVRAMEVEGLQEDSDLEEMERLRATGGKPVPDVEYEPSEAAKEEDQEEEVHMAVYRMMIPLEGKGADHILKGVSDLTLELRSEGIHVQQIHSDRGGEFGGKKIERWCLDRGMLQTFTPGVDPKCNGRAEKAVQVAKDSIRKAL